jgi:4-diphosphocytidyl-2-C-methyl-D-erythritol kinase
MLHSLAYGKVNLCLILGPLRSDGRHELVTLMEPVSLADEVTMETAAGGDDAVICRGVDGPNLASAALAALRARGWEAPPVEVTIDKRIPVAAGMGGGSADAAATLRLAAELAPVAPAVLAEVAASLGSDVPGLIDPGAALATGAGDVVESVGDLAQHAFAILPQPFGLSTAEVYAHADRMGLARSTRELEERRRVLLAALGSDADCLASILVNDLQAAACSLAPEIESALNALRDRGADLAVVCGSGPTVAGVFWGVEATKRAAAAAAAVAGEHPSALVAEPVARSTGVGGGPHLRGGAQSAQR